jgi:hypothetical protein
MDSLPNGGNGGKLEWVLLCPEGYFLPKNGSGGLAMRKFASMLVMLAHRRKIRTEIGAVMLHARHGSVHDGS